VLFTTVQVLHSDSRGHSLTKTEILHSVALRNEKLHTPSIIVRRTVAKQITPWASDHL